MTNQLASLAQRDYFYLDPFWSVNLGTYIIKKVIGCCDVIRGNLFQDMIYFPNFSQNSLFLEPLKPWSLFSRRDSGVDSLLAEWSSTPAVSSSSVIASACRTIFSVFLRVGFVW